MPRAVNCVVFLLELERLLLAHPLINIVTSLSFLLLFWSRAYILIIWYNRHLIQLPLSGYLIRKQCIWSLRRQEIVSYLCPLTAILSCLAYHFWLRAQLRQTCPPVILNLLLLTIFNSTPFCKISKMMKHTVLIVSNKDWRSPTKHLVSVL